MTAVPGVDAESLWRELVPAFSELGDAVSRPASAEEWSEKEAWGRTLGELERAHDYVLLRADLDGSDWSNFCLRQADRVVVAADDGPPPPDGPPAGCDLAFLCTPSVESVAAWTERAKPRAHYVLPAESALPDATQRLCRRLTGRSLGMVLSAAEPAHSLTSGFSRFSRRRRSHRPFGPAALDSAPPASSSRSSSRK